MTTNDQITRAARAIDSKADLSVSGGDVNTVVWENGFSGINLDTLKTKVTEVEADDEKKVYQAKRKRKYPAIGDQLDNLYKDILAGKVDSTGEFAKAIKAVKDAYPKS